MNVYEIERAWMPDDSTHVYVVREMNTGGKHELTLHDASLQKRFLQSCGAESFIDAMGRHIALSINGDGPYKVSNGFHILGAILGKNAPNTAVAWQYANGVVTYPIPPLPHDINNGSQVTDI